MAAIYCADNWCDECADAIKADLAATKQLPDNPLDEYTYDSDEYPKEAGDDEESDTPTHCAAGAECLNAISLPSGYKVGLLFGGLTVEGITYVQEAIREGGEVAELWQQHYTDEGYELDQ